MSAVLLPTWDLLFQRDRLALPEEMYTGGWCQASDMLSEGSGWQIDQIAALGKADGPPGSPVNRDDMMGLGAADGFCRLLGVEMTLFVARNDAWSPASDWHQCYVDIRHLLQPKLRTCVPGIPPPARLLHKKAERGSAMTASSVSPTVVVGGQNEYLQLAERQDVTRLNLPEPRPAGGDWLEQAARACWGDKNR